MINNLKFLVSLDMATLENHGGEVEFTLPFDNENFQIVFHTQSNVDKLHTMFPFTIIGENREGYKFIADNGYITRGTHDGGVYMYLEQSHKFVGVGEQPWAILDNLCKAARLSLDM